jgi:phenylalanyl-tRNA synthetase beta chain
MKISYEWLKSYLPELTLSPQEVGQRLLLAGFPVESFEPAGDDVVLDVEVTSNRPDLLCHVGMAREVAALAETQFDPPAIAPAGQPGPELAKLTSISLKSPDCPHYTARIIEGVKVGPSPAWLVRRLEAIGLRPVNNVVDVTNYVLFELSQPLHAFDYEKLAAEARAGDGPAGRPIIVRRANKGEKLVSIDGHLRELDESMLVIADSSGPVAVAGVMGGLNTEVGPATRTVLLESAYFDPMSIRATARKLGLFSDSSFRFERGVDPGGVEAVSNRAAELIVRLAGGRVLPGLAVDPASRGVLMPGHTPRVVMRLAKMAQLLGIDVPAERAASIFARLGLQPELSRDKATVTVLVPSFRQDLRREVDLIEEVARVEGYDKIPVRDRIEVEVSPPNFRQAAIRRFARVMAAQGFNETVSISFVQGDRAELFARGPAGHLETLHTSRKAENALRRSLLPSLLASRRHNETVQVRRADLFEIAVVFNPPLSLEGEGANQFEPLRLGFVTDGDFRYARGVLEELLRQAGQNAEVELQAKDRPEFVPGESATVLLGGREIGLLGRIAPAVRAAFDLNAEIVACEIDIEPLLELARQPRRYCLLARYPAIERDVSILVDEAVSWRQVERAIREAAPAEPAALEAIDFADLFRGKQFPPGRKSVTFTLRFRLAEGTLTNEQANAFTAAIVDALAKKLGATLRDK